MLLLGLTGLPPAAKRICMPFTKFLATQDVQQGAAVHGAHTTNYMRLTSEWLLLFATGQSNLSCLFK